MNTTTIFTNVCRLIVSTLLLALVPIKPAHAQDTNLNLQVGWATPENGDAKAQYERFRDYEKGIGVRKDHSKAVQYLRQAADLGYPDAEVTLGSFYGRGWGVPRNVVTAASWYKKAANQGNRLAQYALGNFYSSGIGVTNDLDEGIKWWQKAAAQNQVDAEAALGQLYLIPTPGHGTSYLNFTEAIHWLRKAAAQANAGALNNLGVAYENGLGAKRDFKEAAKCYRAAAIQGDARAQSNLGQLYFYGQGVTRDLLQAYVWFKLSATQGNNLGNMGLANYEGNSLLTPGQLAEAEQSVLDYRTRLAKNRIEIQQKKYLETKAGNM